MNTKNIKEEIKKPIESFDIRKMIMKSAPPFEWDEQDYSHPIQQLGYFYFGIGDGFRYDEQKVKEADELTLWKLYALMQTYWLIQYEAWYNKNANLINRMRNYIIIKPEDVGKDMLSVYEKYFDWRK